jgi:hypothetical protein
MGTFVNETTRPHMCMEQGKGHSRLIDKMQALYAICENAMNTSPRPPRGTAEDPAKAQTPNPQFWGEEEKKFVHDELTKACQDIFALRIQFLHRSATTDKHSVSRHLKTD